MKLLTLFFFVLTSTFAFSKDLVPSDSKTPLFIIYEAIIDPPPKDAPPHTHHMHTGHKLLTVYLLSNLVLQPDNKGVKVTLNQEDTKTLDTLTHLYDLLILWADDSASSVMHFRSPIEDGILEFGDSSFSTAVAESIRHRYQVKPSSSDLRTR